MGSIINKLMKARIGGDARSLYTLSITRGHTVDETLEFVALAEIIELPLKGSPSDTYKMSSSLETQSKSILKKYNRREMTRWTPLRESGYF